MARERPDPGFELTPSQAHGNVPAGACERGWRAGPAPAMIGRRGLMPDIVAIYGKNT